MSKGNRSNSKRNSDAIRDLQKRYSEEIDAYKEFAENRRKNRVHSQQKLGEYINRAVDYFDGQDRKGQPYTVAGLLLALEIDRNSWSKMSSGDYDYLLEEYLILSTEQERELSTVPLIPYSEFWEKCSLKIQEQRESACSSLRGNPAGNIFLLKAQNGFREDDTPSHVTQNLVICDGEQAKKALDLLK